MTFHFSNASANANSIFEQTIPNGYRPSTEIQCIFTGCNSSGNGMVANLKIQTNGNMCFTSTVNGLYGSGSIGWQIA